MKRFTLFLSVIVASSFLFVACTNRVSEQEKEEYASKIEDRIVQIDSRVMQLRAEAETPAEEMPGEEGMPGEQPMPGEEPTPGEMQTPMTNGVEARIDELEQQRDRLNSQLSELETVTSENWEEIKQETDQLLADVDQTLNRDTRMGVK